MVKHFRRLAFSSISASDAAGARSIVAYLALAGLSLAVAACGPKQVAELPPPPPVVVPPQPRPPLGAQSNLNVPPHDAMGLRRTINTGISPAQTVWNLRSAYNVAALNCQKVEHAAILDGYKLFLKNNAKTLTAVNRQVDKEFRTANGKSATRAREAYMTQVYNFYALPPTLPAFCDAVVALSATTGTVPSKELETFAAASLPKLDLVFLQFYDSYDQYRADLAAWQQRYAPASYVPIAAASPVPSPVLTQAAR